MTEEMEFPFLAVNLRAILYGQFNIAFKSTMKKIKLLKSILSFVLLFLLTGSACSQYAAAITGAQRVSEYLPLLKHKTVAVVANHTSLIGGVHLVDSLQSLGVNVAKVFAPEHGFRGDAANGEKIDNSKDPKTGLKIISLYGKNYKPAAEDLADVDVVIFDIQDVGTRFYTYLSTLHYVMQACAENGKKLIVLDRPNPNGYFIDGPVLKPGYESMVGLHPIPIVHGMTLGELALMINGEHWIKTSRKCALTVIKMQRWDHNTIVFPTVPPSPNLQSDASIVLYPTLCLLEGTEVSMGRGTNHPFECFGAPWLKAGSYTFVPKNIPGKAMNPPFLNDTCHGFYLKEFAESYLTGYNQLYLEWIELLYQNCPDNTRFFNDFFDKLAGTNSLRLALQKRTPLAEIRKSWKDDLDAFEIKRKPYLLYPHYPGEAPVKSR